MALADREARRAFVDGVEDTLYRARAAGPALAAVEEFLRAVDDGLSEAWDQATYDPGWDVEFAEDLDGTAAGQDRDLNHLSAVSLALGLGLPVVGWSPAARNPGEDARVERASAQFQQAATRLVEDFDAGRISAVEFRAGIAAAYLRQARNAFLAGKRALGNLAPLTLADERAIGATLRQVGLDPARDPDPGTLGRVVASLALAGMSSTPAGEDARGALGAALARYADDLVRRTAAAGFDQASRDRRAALAASVERARRGDEQAQASLASLGPVLDAGLTGQEALRARREREDAERERQRYEDRLAAARALLAADITAWADKASGQAQRDLERLRRALLDGTTTPQDAADRLAAMLDAQARAAFLRAMRAAGFRGGMSPADYQRLADAADVAQGTLLDDLPGAVARGSFIGAIAAMIFSPWNLADPDLVRWLWGKFAGVDDEYNALMGAGERAAFDTGGTGYSPPAGAPPAEDLARALAEQPPPAAPEPSALAHAVLAWWQLDPQARHCADCLRLAGMSPYYLAELDKMGLHPGSGHTQCGPNCRCTLQYDVPTEVEWPGGGTVPMAALDAQAALEGEPADDNPFDWDQDVAARIEPTRGALALPQALRWLERSRPGEAPFLRVPGQSGAGLVLVQRFELPGSGLEYAAVFQDDRRATRFVAGAMTQGDALYEPEFTAAALRWLAAHADERGLAVEFDGRTANEGLDRLLRDAGAQRAAIPVPEPLRSHAAPEPLRPSGFGAGEPLPGIAQPLVPDAVPYEPLPDLEHVSEGGVVQAGWNAPTLQSERDARLRALFPDVDARDWAKFDDAQVDSVLQRAELLRQRGFQTDLLQHVETLPDDSPLAGEAHADGTIALKRAMGVGGTHTVSDTFGDTFAHEYGHLVAGRVGQRLGAEGDPLGVVEMAEANAGRLSAYADSKPQEFWAEAFAAMTRADYRPGALAGDERAMAALRDAGVYSPRSRMAGPAPDLPDAVFPFDNILDPDSEEGDLQAGWEWVTPTALAGGTSPRQLFRDPRGREWVWKSNWADAEVAGSKVTRLVGLNAPDVGRVKYGDEWGAIMPFVPGQSLAKTPLASLSRGQDRDMFAHGLVDYLLGNVDGHAGNYILAPDGSIWAIDKGFALFDLPADDTLASLVYSSRYGLGEPYRAGGSAMADLFRYRGITRTSEVLALTRMAPDDVAAVLDRFDAVPESAFRRALGSPPDEVAHTSLQRKLMLRADTESLFRQVVDDHSNEPWMPQAWLDWREEGGVFERTLVGRAPELPAVPGLPALEDILDPRGSKVLVGVHPEDVAKALAGASDEERRQAEQLFGNVVTLWKKDPTVVPNDWYYWQLYGGSFGPETLAHPGGGKWATGHGTSGAGWSADKKEYGTAGWGKWQPTPYKPPEPTPFDGETWKVENGLPWKEGDPAPVPAEVGDSPVLLDSPQAPWSGKVPKEPKLPKGVMTADERERMRKDAEDAWLTWEDVKAGGVNYAVAWGRADTDAARKAGLFVEKAQDGRYYAARSKKDYQALLKQIAAHGTPWTATDDFWTGPLGFTSQRLGTIDAWDAAKATRRSLRAGVIVEEPDGRVWFISPRNRFAGYENTWPKGGVDGGETTAQAAVRELREETGMSVELDSFLGDFESSDGGSLTRYYVGHRTGGGPSYLTTKKETYAVRLGTTEQVRPVLLRYGKPDKRDTAVLDAYREYRGLPPLGPPAEVERAAKTLGEQADNAPASTTDVASKVGYDQPTAEAVAGLYGGQAEYTGTLPEGKFHISTHQDGATAVLDSFTPDGSWTPGEPAYLDSLAGAILGVVGQSPKGASVELHLTPLQISMMQPAFDAIGKYTWSKGVMRLDDAEAAHLLDAMSSPITSTAAATAKADAAALLQGLSTDAAAAASAAPLVSAQVGYDRLFYDSLGAPKFVPADTGLPNHKRRMSWPTGNAGGEEMSFTSVRPFQAGAPGTTISNIITADAGEVASVALSDARKSTLMLKALRYEGEATLNNPLSDGLRVAQPFLQNAPGPVIEVLHGVAPAADLAAPGVHLDKAEVQRLVDTLNSDAWPGPGPALIPAKPLDPAAQAAAPHPALAHALAPEPAQAPSGATGWAQQWGVDPQALKEWQAAGPPTPVPVPGSPTGVGAPNAHGQSWALPSGKQAVLKWQTTPTGNFLVTGTGFAGQGLAPGDVTTAVAGQMAQFAKYMAFPQFGYKQHLAVKFTGVAWSALPPEAQQLLLGYGAHHAVGGAGGAGWVIGKSKAQELAADAGKAANSPLAAAAQPSLLGAAHIDKAVFDSVAPYYQTSMVPSGGLGFVGLGVSTGVTPEGALGGTVEFRATPAGYVLETFQAGGLDAQQSSALFLKAVQKVAENPNHLVPAALDVPMGTLADIVDAGGSGAGAAAVNDLHDLLLAAGAQEQAHVGAETHLLLTTDQVQALANAIKDDALPPAAAAAHAPTGPSGLLSSLGIDKDKWQAHYGTWSLTPAGTIEAESSSAGGHVAPYTSTWGHLDDHLTFIGLHVQGMQSTSAQVYSFLNSMRQAHEVLADPAAAMKYARVNVPYTQLHGMTESAKQQITDLLKQAGAHEEDVSGGAGPSLVLEKGKVQTLLDKLDRDSGLVSGPGATAAAQPEASDVLKAALPHADVKNMPADWQWKQMYQDGPQFTIVGGQPTAKWTATQGGDPEAGYSIKPGQPSASLTSLHVPPGYPAEGGNMVVLLALAEAPTYAGQGVTVAADVWHAHIGAELNAVLVDKYGATSLSGDLSLDSQGLAQLRKDLADAMGTPQVVPQPPLAAAPSVAPAPVAPVPVAPQAPAAGALAGASGVLLPGYNPTEAKAYAVVGEVTDPHSALLAHETQQSMRVTVYGPPGGQAGTTVQWRRRGNRLELWSVGDTGDQGSAFAAHLRRMSGIMDDYPKLDRLVLKDTGSVPAGIQVWLHDQGMLSAAGTGTLMRDDLQKAVGLLDDDLAQYEKATSGPALTSEFAAVEGYEPALVKGMAPLNEQKVAPSYLAGTKNNTATMSAYPSGAKVVWRRRGNRMEVWRVEAKVGGGAAEDTNRALLAQVRRIADYADANPKVDAFWMMPGSTPNLSTALYDALGKYGHAEGYETVKFTRPQLLKMRDAMDADLAPGAPAAPPPPPWETLSPLAQKGVAYEPEWAHLGPGAVDLTVEDTVASAKLAGQQNKMRVAHYASPAGNNYAVEWRRRGNYLEVWDADGASAEVMLAHLRRMAEYMEANPKVFRLWLREPATVQPDLMAALKSGYVSNGKTILAFEGVGPNAGQYYIEREALLDLRDAIDADVALKTGKVAAPGPSAAAPLAAPAQANPLAQKIVATVHIDQAVLKGYAGVVPQLSGSGVGAGGAHYSVVDFVHPDGYTSTVTLTQKAGDDYVIAALQPTNGSAELQAFNALHWAAKSPHPPFLPFPGNPFKSLLIPAAEVDPVMADALLQYPAVIKSVGGYFVIPKGMAKVIADDLDHALGAVATGPAGAHVVTAAAQAPKAGLLAFAGADADKWYAKLLASGTPKQNAVNKAWSWSKGEHGLPGPSMGKWSNQTYNNLLTLHPLGGQVSKYSKEEYLATWAATLHLVAKDAAAQGKGVQIYTYGVPYFGALAQADTPVAQMKAMLASIGVPTAGGYSVTVQPTDVPKLVAALEKNEAASPGMAAALAAQPAAAAAAPSHLLAGAQDAKYQGFLAHAPATSTTGDHPMLFPAGKFKGGWSGTVRLRVTGLSGWSSGDAQVKVWQFDGPGSYSIPDAERLPLTLAAMRWAGQTALDQGKGMWVRKGLVLADEDKAAVDKFFAALGVPANTPPPGTAAYYDSYWYVGQQDVAKVVGALKANSTGAGVIAAAAPPVPAAPGFTPKPYVPKPKPPLPGVVAIDAPVPGLPTAPGSPWHAPAPAQTTAQAGAAGPVIPDASRLSKQMGYDHAQVKGLMALGSSDVPLGQVTTTSIPQTAFEADFILAGGERVEAIYALSPSQSVVAFTDLKASPGVSAADREAGFWAALQQFADATAGKASNSKALLWVTRPMYDSRPALRQRLLDLGGNEVLDRPGGTTTEIGHGAGKVFDAYGPGITLTPAQAEKLAKAIQADTDDAALQGQVLAAQPAFKPKPAPPGTVANNPLAYIGVRPDELWSAGGEVIRPDHLRAVSSWAGGAVEAEWVKHGAILRWADLRVVGAATDVQVRAAAIRTLDGLLADIGHTPGMALDVDHGVWETLPDMRDLLAKWGGRSVDTADGPMIRLNSKEADELSQDIRREMGALGPAGTTLPATVPPTVWPAPQDLKPSPNAATLAGKGQTPKSLWVDSSGTEWLFKPGKTGAGAHRDEAVDQLAGLLGVRVPHAREYVLPYEGKPTVGSLQQMVPNVHYVKGVAKDAKGVPDFSAFTPDQTNELWQQGVLDWLVANDDSHAGNFLVDTDGHFWGIDKTRAWVSKGSAQDTLDPASGGQGGALGLPPLRNLWWRAVKADPAQLGKLSPRAVARTLAYVDTITEDQFLKVVQPVLLDSQYYPQFRTAEAMREALVKRKRSTRADIEGLFRQQLTAVKQSGGALPPEWEQWLAQGGKFEAALTRRDQLEERLGDLQQAFGADATRQRLSTLLSQGGAPGFPGATIMKAAKDQLKQYSGGGLPGVGFGGQKLGAAEYAGTTTAPARDYMTALNEWMLLSIVLSDKPASSFGLDAEFVRAMRASWSDEEGTFLLNRAVSNANGSAAGAAAYYDEKVREGFRQTVAFGFTPSDPPYPGHGLILTARVRPDQVYNMSYLTPDYYNAGTGELEVMIRDLTLDQVVHMHGYGTYWYPLAGVTGVSNGGGYGGGTSVPNSEAWPPNSSSGRAVRWADLEKVYQYMRDYRGPVAPGRPNVVPPPGS